MNIVITSIVVVLAASIGYVSYLVWGPDNKVEENCEKVIQTQTGADVDLSPSTPEQSADEIADAKLVISLTNPSPELKK